MLVGIFRPWRQEPSWRFHETASREYSHRYTSVMLEPLARDDARELVANLLHVEDLPEKVRALILQKAEGNPFFVEEVIRSLLDAGLVVSEGGHWRATREIVDIAVPDTLAGVITARLDRLDDEAKRVTQTASVIGREFHFDTLAEVYGPADSLNETVIELQRRELVREKSRLPERVYVFKHVMTQETAYDSLLLSRRRELHGRVAEHLERTAAERVNDIARHFIEAREEARALPYLVDSADGAARGARLRDCRRHCVIPAGTRRAGTRKRRITSAKSLRGVGRSPDVRIRRSGSGGELPQDGPRRRRARGLTHAGIGPEQAGVRVDANVGPAPGGRGAPRGCRAPSVAER